MALRRGTRKVAICGFPHARPHAEVPVSGVMEPKDYRAMFWTAYEGLCALTWAAKSQPLPAEKELRVIAKAGDVWLKRVIDRLGDPLDEGGWPTKGPCSCGERQ